MRLREIYQTVKDIIIVMEYMSGGTLFHRLMTKRQYNEKEAAVLLTCLMQGLEIMHSRRIIHRDIKLENIFLPTSNDVLVKVGDFDLAIEGEETNRENVIGTPGYIAPEIFSKMPGVYSNKCDIFSSGVVLYTILIGCFPFRAVNVKEMMEKNKKYEIRLFGQRWENLSPDCRDLLEKMLARDPILRLDCRGVLSHRWIRRFGGETTMYRKSNS